MNIMKMGKSRPLDRLVEEQVNRWMTQNAQRNKGALSIPLRTISRQFGSGGYLVAKQIADDFGLDLFDREIIQEIADDAHVRATVAETVVEKGIPVFERMVSVVTSKHRLCAYQYLNHLTKVITVIGKHGHAVIVGRGANFILPSEKTFRARIVAPFEMRVENVAQEVSLSIRKAKKLTSKTDSDRKLFMRKYFNADIDNPHNYDSTINNQNMSVDAAVATIRTALTLRYPYRLASSRKTDVVHLKEIGQGA
jgi:cytidylate kinase